MNYNAIITSVVALCGISASLALALSIANATIGNYGSKKLTINGHKTLEVDGGSSLLSTLIDNEIFIPSACGGKGSCGYCKVTVTEGGGEVLPTELGYLSPKEQQEGVRLSCQCKVKSDLALQIPEELFNVKQYTYTVFQNDLVNSTVKHLILDLPKDKTIDFKPGQYIQILTPEYGDSTEEVYRAYSLASPPSQNTRIELFIGRVPNGVCTTYIHDYLKVGQKLNVVGPFGDFYYTDGDSHLVMVAIGTGLAPIMSILRHMHERGITRPVSLFFSAKNKKELYMMDRIQVFERELPGFKLYLSLTRATEEDQWKGDTVRVPQLLNKYLTSEIAATSHAYMCGSPLMIDSATEALIALGMPQGQIFYDKFE